MNIPAFFNSHETFAKAVAAYRNPATDDVPAGVAEDMIFLDVPRLPKLLHEQTFSQRSLRLWLDRSTHRDPITRQPMAPTSVLQPDIATVVALNALRRGAIVLDRCESENLRVQATDLGPSAAGAQLLEQAKQLRERAWGRRLLINRERRALNQALRRPAECRRQALAVAVLIGAQLTPVLLASLGLPALVGTVCHDVMLGSAFYLLAAT